MKWEEWKTRLRIKYNGVSAESRSDLSGVEDRGERVWEVSSGYGETGKLPMALATKSEAAPQSWSIWGFEQRAWPQRQDFAEAEGIKGRLSEDQRGEREGDGGLKEQ